jgi:hypothetical protein
MIDAATRAYQVPVDPPWGLLDMAGATSLQRWTTIEACARRILISRGRRAADFAHGS